MSAFLACRTPARIGLIFRAKTSSSIATTFCTALGSVYHHAALPSRLKSVSSSVIQVSEAVTDASTHADAVVRVGQVISSEANFLRVKLPPPSSNDKQLTQPPLLCQVRGVLRKKQQRVLVGDHVQVGAINWKENRGMVEAILPRSSQLTDPAVANVDNVVLLFSLTNPPFEEEQVSRFLVSAEAARLPLTLILNKGDLVDDERREQIVDVCRSWGYEPFVVSCSTVAGVREVAEELKGRVSVVAGPSGVGKSSLINVLRLGKHRREIGGDISSGTAARPQQDELPESDSSSGAGSAISDTTVCDECDSSSGLLLSSSSREGPATHDSLSGERSTPDLQESSALADLVNSAAQPRRDDHLPSHTPADACSHGNLQPAALPQAGGSALDFVSVGELSKIKRGTHTTRTVSLLQLPGGGLLADSPGFNQPSLDKVASQDLMHCFPEIQALMEAEGCRFRDCLHIQEPGCCINGAGLQRWPFYLKLLAEVQAREQHEEEVLQLSKRQREGETKMKIGRGGLVRHELRLSAKKHRRVSRNKATQQWQQALDE